MNLKTVINKKTRFINFIFDSVIVGFFINLVIYLSYYLNNSYTIDETKEERKLIVLTCLTMYYILSESIFGVTIGKIITKTKVVGLSGEKPTIFQILIRSLCRLLPIDVISYLGWGSRGVHDIFSKTKLVSTKS